MGDNDKSSSSMKGGGGGKGSPPNNDVKKKNTTTTSSTIKTYPSRAKAKELYAENDDNDNDDDDNDNDNDDDEEDNVKKKKSCTTTSSTTPTYPSRVTAKKTNTKVMEKEASLSESEGNPKKVSFARNILVRVYFPSKQCSTTTCPTPTSTLPRTVPLSQMKYTSSASVSPSILKPTTSSLSESISGSGSGSQITASPPASPSCSSKPNVAFRFPKRVPLSQRKYTSSPSALSSSLTDRSASAQGRRGSGQSVNNKSGATGDNPTFKHC